MRKSVRLSEYKNEFISGFKATFPLVVGAIPFGLIFGTLAAVNGLSFELTIALSALVFAGSSQFIALGLIAAGTAWPIIVFTTFIVNLRHLVVLGDPGYLCKTFITSLAFLNGVLAHR